VPRQLSVTLEAVGTWMRLPGDRRCGRARRQPRTWIDIAKLCRADCSHILGAERPAIKPGISERCGPLSDELSPNLGDGLTGQAAVMAG
jgi:hypothetical protein